jgi:hypothetical protein
MAVGKIADRLGHPPCTSGFDLAFRQELNVVIVDKELEAQTFGKLFGRSV